MVESSKKTENTVDDIPGRGGATLCHLKSDAKVHTLLLLFGADRT